MKLFACRGVTPPDEPANEKMHRVARRLAEGEQVRTNEPGAYFHGVARNVLREHWARLRERPVGVRRDHERTALHPTGHEEVEDAETCFRCLESCLASLPAEMGRVIKVYYGQAGAGSARPSPSSAT